MTRLARSLDFALTKAEAEKAGRSKNPDAIDLIMRGDDLFNRGIEQPEQKPRAARALFERALQIDPNDAEALAGSAQTYYLIGTTDGATRGPTTTPKCWGKPIEPSISPPNDPGVYFPKASISGLVAPAQ